MIVGVTGAAGFIGRHCVPSLQARGYEVHAVNPFPMDPSLPEAVWHRDLLGSGSGAARLFAMGIDVAQTNETAGACRARDEALTER